VLRIVALFDRPLQFVTPSSGQKPFSFARIFFSGLFVVVHRVQLTATQSTIGAGPVDFYRTGE
jgi:hypothetical protein